MKTSYPTLLNIPSDLYFNVLRQKIRRLPNSGLIIESLDSDFLKTPAVALHALLYAFGNAKHIQVVILNQTYAEVIVADEAVRKKKQDRKKFTGESFILLILFLRYSN